MRGGKRGGTHLHASRTPGRVSLARAAVSKSDAPPWMLAAKEGRLSRDTVSDRSILQLVSAELLSVRVHWRNVERSASAERGAVPSDSSRAQASHRTEPAVPRRYKSPKLRLGVPIRHRVHPAIRSRRTGYRQTGEDHVNLPVVWPEEHAVHENTVVKHVDLVVQYFGLRITRDYLQNSAIEEVNADTLVCKIEVEVTDREISAPKRKSQLPGGGVDPNAQDQSIMDADVLSDLAECLRNAWK